MKILFLICLGLGFSASAQKPLLQVNKVSGINTTRSLAFEENVGQIEGRDAAQVNFVLKDKGFKVFLLNTGLAYQFERNSNLVADLNFEEIEESDDFSLETYRIDLVFVGANPKPRISKEQNAEDYFNYFKAEKHMVSNSYAKVTYHDVYPKIDWVIYVQNGSMKYDFVVRPGGDLNQIQLQAKWAEQLKLGEDGSLTMTSPFGTITELVPVSFQGKKNIPTGFKISGNMIHFSVGKYQKNETLIIDPSLLWSTYYGSTGLEHATATRTDAQGNIYLAGWTTSTIFIADGGHQMNFGGNRDAFLVKFNSQGNRIWATYYGGAGNDRALGCATDNSGSIYLCGTTTSVANIADNGFQNVRAGNRDGFLVKFNANGARQWGTYFGGVLADDAYACHVDNSGNVLLVGDTKSTEIVGINGYQTVNGGGTWDGFIAKFTANGGLMWGTFFGGELQDVIRSVCTDSFGNVIIAGSTSTTFGLINNGFQTQIQGGTDAFLLKMSPTGSPIWSTYYGGTGTDRGFSCAVDLINNIYLVGSTVSQTGIALNGHQNTYGSGRDAYLVKFLPNGTPEWATYYGGNGAEDGFACHVDSGGNVFLVGSTASLTGINYDSGQPTYGGGTSDALIAQFKSNGVLQWAQYFGGENADVGLACTSDLFGNVYLAGRSESTNTVGFQGFQNVLGGQFDGFLTKFNLSGCTPTLEISIVNTTVCSGETVQLTANPNNGGFTPTYHWQLNGVDFGPNAASFSYSNFQNGDVVTCELISSAPCADPINALSNDALNITVVPYIQPVITITPSTLTACAGETVTFTAEVTNAGNNPTFTWKKNGAVVGGNSASIALNNLQSTDVISCQLTAAVCANPVQVLSNPISIEVQQPVVPAFDPIAAYCQGSTIPNLPTSSTNGISGTWIPAINNQQTTNYTFTPSGGGCVANGNLTITILLAPEINLTIADTTIVASGGYDNYTWFFEGNLIQGQNASMITNVGSGLYTVEVLGANGCVGSNSINYGSSGLANLAEFGVRIYPNPFSEEIQIQLADLSLKTLEVKNVLGQILMRAETSMANFSMNLSSLPAGLYHLVVRSEITSDFRSFSIVKQ